MMSAKWNEDYFFALLALLNGVQKIIFEDTDTRSQHWALLLHICMQFPVITSLIKFQKALRNKHSETVTIPLNSITVDGACKLFALCLLQGCSPQKNCLDKESVELIPALWKIL